MACWERDKRVFITDWRLVGKPGGQTLLKCRRSTLQELVSAQCVAIGPGGNCWVTPRGRDWLRQSATVQRNVAVPVGALEEFDEYVKDLRKQYQI